MSEETIRKSLSQLRSLFNTKLDSVVNADGLHQLGITRQKYLQKYEEYCLGVSINDQRSSVHYDKKASDLAWSDIVKKIMKGEMSQEGSYRSEGEISTPSQGQSIEEKGNMLALHLARAVDRLNIAYSLLFDGDSANYLKFINYFENKFNSKSFDEYELMTHLVKSCTGRALAAIQMYEGIDGGYQLARKVLERRFGKPYEIVERTMNKVSTGLRLKPDDIEGLNLYSCQLESAYETLRAHGATAEANSEQFLVKIFNRLPQHIQQKWLGENQRIRDTRMRNPKFREMVSFIIRMAEASDSVYKVKPNNPSSGCREASAGKGLPPRSGSGSASPRVTSLATGVQEPTETDTTSVGQPTRRTLKCVSCRGNHTVDKCPDFAAMDYRQRRDLVVRLRLCYRCLESHMARTCTGGELCTDVSCKDEHPHHRLLHRQQKPVKPQGQGGPRNQDSGENQRTHNTTTAPKIPSNQNPKPKSTSMPSSTPDMKTSGGSGQTGPEQVVTGASRMDANDGDDGERCVLLQIVPVEMSVGGGSVTTLGMIDSGSQGTLVEKCIMERLGVMGRAEKLGITTVTGTTENIDVDVFSCKMAPVDGGVDRRYIDVPRVLAVERLPLENLKLPNGIQFYPHLKDVNFHGYVDVNRVTVLIGQDVPEAHMPLETRFGNDPAHEPYAVRSAFGWSIAGPARKLKPKVSSNPNILVNYLDANCGEPDQGLEEAVRKWWDLERHGFTNDDKKCPSVEDRLCLEVLEKTTRCVDERYQSAMLWKRDPVLPNNRLTAQRRLDQLIRKFRRDPEFYEEYRKEMDEYVNNEYARRMLKSEAALSTPLTWYLPHHAVPKKSGKLRIVYDAAAETSGVSLNSQLCSGPDLTNSLVGCLLRFRQYEVAVLADIQSMFHRVKCLPADSDSLRYLWIPDGLDSPPVEYQMTSHVFGKKDSPTVCTYALRRCAEDQKDRFSAEAVTCVNRNFYVDDLLTSVSTVEAAVKLSQELISMMDCGGFRLMKFLSNRVEIVRALPPDRVSPALSEVEFNSELPLERALGTRWDIASDTIGVKVDDSKEFAATRRGCLSQICSTFDPLGIIAPVALVGKRILQAVTRLKIGWDEPLPDHLMSAWLTWRRGLQSLDGIGVPRCYFPTNGDAELTLHHFSDACEEGYGAVSYLRVEYPHGEVRVAFLTSKSRTAPSNFTTVARLELHACVIAARLHSFVMRELDLNVMNATFYTDSTIAYQYVTSTTRRFHTYIANRTTEFRDLADPERVFVIPGKQNPADEASRGCMPEKFLKNDRFLNGPKFLLLPRETWPVRRPGQLPDDDPEIKPERPFVLAAMTGLKTIGDLIARYSSWTLLKRKTAYLQKVVDALTSKTAASLVLTPDDLLRAERNLVRFVQSERFAGEVSALKKKQPVSTSSSLRKLNPQLDPYGILRVGGRLQHSTLQYDQRFPIILPKDHALTRSVILHYHVKSGHSGTNHVLALTRERFWIIHGKAEVRRLVGRCFTCRKYLATKLDQVMADLPEVRTTSYVPPFQEATGIDFIGPFLVKRGRSQVKRYACLFTCLHTRCVHIEMACGLDTPSFVNCLRRHQSRRGVSKEYWCDNGTNFVGAERELARSIREWNEAHIAQEFLQEGIVFHFLPPLASHMAGVWERLVRSTKRALYGVLKDAFVCEDVLSTALAEAERILNSRPLCPVSTDPNDLEVLTPNHLLLQRTFSNLPPGLFVDADKYRSKFRQSQYLAEGIWRRFVNEYIPALQERAKWLRPRKSLDVNDVVVVTEKDLPRSKWLIGRVVRTFPGRDGRVRSVEVKTRSSTIIRPIHKLALVEGQMDAS